MYKLKSVIHIVIVISHLTLSRVCPYPLSLVVIRMFHTTLRYVEVLSSDGFYMVCCACVHRRMIKSWPSVGNFPPPFPMHFRQRRAQVCEFKYVTDVCVVCRRCVLYQMPRHSRKNAPSLLHDLYLLVLLRTSDMLTLTCQVRVCGRAH